MRKQVFTIICLLLGSFGPAKASELPPTILLESLSPDLANKIVVASVAECFERGYILSVSEKPTLPQLYGLVPLK